MDAFGVERTTATGSLADASVGFAGQYLDDATGLYDMRARDYDPSSGRFTATDPVAVPTGMPFVAGYSYAFNNPLMYSDPSGLFVGCSGLESFVWGLIGKSCGSNDGANNAGNFTGGFGEESKTLATDAVAGVAQLATPAGQGQAAAGFAGAVQNDGWVKGSLNASGATDLANDAYMTPVYVYQGNYRAAGASAADPTWTAIMTYESALLGAMGPAMGALGPMAASSRCVTVVGVRTARFVTTSAGVTIDRAAVRATLSLQRQGRHVLGARQYGGGSYFRSMVDAQRVLDDFKSGAAEVLGVKGNDIVVRDLSVTGINVNPGAGFPSQPTNVFFIKGGSSPSVVPFNPAWKP